MTIPQIKNTLKSVGNNIKDLKHLHREYTSTSGLLEYVKSDTYKNVYKNAVKTLEKRRKELKAELQKLERTVPKIKKDANYHKKLKKKKTRIKELKATLYRLKYSPCDFTNLGNGLDWMYHGSIDMYTPHRITTKLSEKKKKLKNKARNSMGTLERSCNEYEKTLADSKLDPEKKTQIESIYQSFMQELDSVFSDEDLLVFMGPNLRRIRIDMLKEMTILNEIVNNV